MSTFSTCDRMSRFQFFQIIKNYIINYNIFTKKLYSKSILTSICKHVTLMITSKKIYNLKTMRKKNMSILHKISTNWKSGLTVAFVSIPVSISLAVASQASPISGIITAIWAGLIASLFGGSDYNIIVPTGALSGVLALHAIVHGSSTLPSVAIVSGIFIFIAYILHLEKYLFFISASTIHGFTLGVACMIILGQLNAILGLNNLPIHHTIFENFIETCKNLPEYSLPTVTIFCCSIIILWLFSKYIPSVPNVILLSPLGIFLGYLTTHHIVPISLSTLQTKFGHITPMLYQPIDISFNYSTITTGFVVALIALIETMIAARIADNLTHTKHNKQKEVLGLSLANIVSGLMGGLPANAGLARSSLNIKAGAHNKMSATINSIGVAVLSLLFLSYFAYLPLVIIAAILTCIAIRMVDIHHFKKLYALDKQNFFVALAVAAITIYEDPTVGIICGIVLSSIILLNSLSKEQFELHHHTLNYPLSSDKRHTTSDIFFYSFKGELTFINSQAHIAHFERNFDQYSSIVLRLKDVTFIDFDGVEAIDYIINLMQAAHKKVVLTSINPLILTMLKHSQYVVDLEKKGYVFKNTTQALEFLKGENI